MRTHKHKRHYSRAFTDVTLCGRELYGPAILNVYLAFSEADVTCLSCKTTLDEPWHGTSGGYNNHNCRCDACTAANADYQTDWRDRHWGTEPPVHGANGYTNYGCRCDVCRKAHAAESKARRERRKARRKVAA